MAKHVLDHKVIALTYQHGLLGELRPDLVEVPDQCPDEPPRRVGFRWNGGVAARKPEVLQSSFVDLCVKFAMGSQSDSMASLPKSSPQSDEGLNITARSDSQKSDLHVRASLPCRADREATCHLTALSFELLTRQDATFGSRSWPTVCQGRGGRGRANGERLYSGRVKVVIPGGSGQVGQVLARAYASDGHEVVILSRGSAIAAGRVVLWDGCTLGRWADELDGADLVLNLAGRSVNCRYTNANLKAMMDSRVDSTRVVGEAIARAARPPGVWMQMSTATIYAHRFDAPNDEAMGVMGGEEPGVPGYWAYSVQIAHNWEQALADAQTPVTR